MRHDPRMLERIGRADFYLAATGWPAIRNAERDPRKRIGRQQRTFTLFRNKCREGLHIKLHIRARLGWIGFEKPAALIDAQTKRPLAHRQILDTRFQFAPPRTQRLVQCRHAHFPRIVQRRVILEVLADMRIVMTDRNAESLQMVRRANPRKLEQLRAIDRTARQDHLPPRLCKMCLAALHIFDARYTHPLEDQSRHLRARLDTQIGTIHGGP